ncbi:fimbria/pilus outer membrane usher protein [Acinetobacter wuhouensis]|nr:fimbria/pilus outer membrane usher protein [Acinetobacter wuhouensis]
MNKFKLSMLLCGILSSVYTHAEQSATQLVTHIEQEISLANLWINGVDRKVETLMIQKNGQIYIECNVFKTLDINESHFSRDSTNLNYCLLSKAPIKTEIDDALQALKIELPAEYFEGSDYNQKLILPDRANFGGFLNYETYYGRDNANKEFSALAELGIFHDYWLFDNQMLYRDTEMGAKTTRLSTNFDIRFPEHFLKVTVGDNTSIFNSLLSSYRFGGINIGSDFTDRPDFIYWNVPTLKGSATLPSTVDLFINGVNMYQQKVTPGYYALQSGAAIQQGGQAQIVVEDVLGNRTVQSFPIYINNRLLKTGLNEYNFSLGKMRYNYNEENNDYREFFTNVYYRRGLSSSTTLGTNIGYSDDISNLSLLWTQAISQYAVLDYSLTASRSHEQTAYSNALSLSRDTSTYSLGLMSKYNDRNFKALGYLDYIDLTKMDNLVYLNLFQVPWINNLNFNYVERKYYQTDQRNNPDAQIISLGLFKNINKQTTFSMNYFKNLSGTKNDGFSLGLSYSFDHAKKAYVDHDTSADMTRLRYVQNSVLGENFDYALGVNRVGSDYSYNAYGLWKTNQGDMSLTHDQSDHYHNTQFDYRGALVFLDNKFSFTKYVDNGFALVNIDGYKDVDITRSLSLVGKTNDKGYLFIHDIIPYVHYDLAFDHNQLPLEDVFTHSKKRVVALNQRGYVVDFPVYKTKTVIVKLLDENQQTFKQGSIVYVSTVQNDKYPIDEEGKVYLYGLKPDKYDLLIKTQGGRSCNTLLDISNNEAQQSQIYNLVCR